jgi:ATP-dependent DNA helicase RecG
MTIERIKNILVQGEGIRTEFKKAQSMMPANLFETICAMLNHTGGDILLGADDKGNVTGILPEKVDEMITNITNLSNNPQKLNPPFILFPKIHIIDGLQMIHLQVPESSQVHQTAGKIYDRSNDGDFEIKDPYQVAELHNRKRNHYTEMIIYPAFRFEDFNLPLFTKVRNLIRSNNAGHPWLGLSDEQMLKIAGLWNRDYKTGEEGYTLAAVLLLGKDEVIQRIVPHYKIDALVRRENITRYDDRLYIQTNLIEAYEQLLEFVAKHLPDKFYLEGDQRRSLRTIIFRELASNILIHKEYTNAYPTTFVITRTAVVAENANIPNGEGPISVDNFKPFPKNPTIAKFFMQLGRFDELGSGVLNINHYLKAYSGHDDPQFIEGYVFKTIIPLDENLNKGLNDASDRISDRISDKINDRINDRIKKGIIDNQSKIVQAKLCELAQFIYKMPLSNAKELALSINVSVPTVNRYLKLLKLIGVSELQGARKTGGYILTDSFKSDLGKV